MRLDRNENPTGMGKYALINLRTNVVEWGAPFAPDEFFVLKLKDRHAQAALIAYAESIRDTDPEFAEEVIELSKRSGEDSDFCKEPD